MSFKGTTFAGLLDLGLNEKGYFVALKKDGVARVYRLDEDEEKGLKQLWEFKEFVSSKLCNRCLFPYLWSPRSTLNFIPRPCLREGMTMKGILILDGFSGRMSYMYVSTRTPAFAANR